MKVRRLRRLQAGRMFFEARIVHDVPERLASDLSLADVRMAIHARAEIGFGIVQVKSEDLLHADERTQLANRRVPALRRANVVTRGKEVRRVQADAKPRGLFDLVENRAEM